MPDARGQVGEFERALSAVKAIGGLSHKELAALRHNVLEVVKRLPAAPAEIVGRMVRQPDEWCVCGDQRAYHHPVIGCSPGYRTCKCTRFRPIRRH